MQPYYVLGIALSQTILHNHHNYVMKWDRYYSAQMRSARHREGTELV